MKKSNQDMTNLPMATNPNLGEKMVLLRAKSPTYLHYPADIVHNDWDPTRKALYSIAMKVGLTEPIQKAEQYELCRFIQGQFRDLNMEELVEAFDLYCSGELDFKKSSYNVLSNLFIGNVLQSFRRYRTQQLKKHTIKHKALPLPDNKPLDKKQYYEDQLFSKYDRLLKGEYVFSRMDEFFLYKSLSAIGVNFGTPEEKRKLMGQVTKDMVFGERLSDEAKQEKIKNRCMELSFQTWIKSKADFELNLKEEILKLL